MNDDLSKPLRDIQNSEDTRNIAIDKVGIKDIEYPIIVLDKREKEQHTIARINMYVDLPGKFKGTHMSRFVEILNRYRNVIHVDTIPGILTTMKEVFNAGTAHLEIAFPYFIAKKAPVSGAEGLMAYPCRFKAAALSDEEGRDFVLEVAVPCTTLCPCSKEISRDGAAHNQRSRATVAIRYAEMVWIEDLVALVENCASAPLYSVLKRTDEKYVTEKAYENPKFVEDVVRDISLALDGLDAVTWYQVEVENFESIHNHSAYACIERGEPGTDKKGGAQF
jgi:GTP cyclohydrolase I